MHVSHGFRRLSESTAPRPLMLGVRRSQCANNKGVYDGLKAVAKSGKSKPGESA